MYTTGQSSFRNVKASPCQSSQRNKLSDSVSASRSIFAESLRDAQSSCRRDNFYARPHEHRVQNCPWNWGKQQVARSTRLEVVVGRAGVAMELRPTTVTVKEALTLWTSLWWFSGIMTPTVFMFGLALVKRSCRPCIYHR